MYIRAFFKTRTGAIIYIDAINSFCLHKCLNLTVLEVINFSSVRTSTVSVKSIMILVPLVSSLSILHPANVITAKYDGKTVVFPNGFAFFVCLVFFCLFGFLLFWFFDFVFVADKPAK